MRIGDRFDLPEEAIHGSVSWILSDEVTGDLLAFVVSMDNGRFAAINPARLPAESSTLQ